MEKVKTVLIDDEPDGIEQMELLLSAYHQIEIIKTFTSSVEALAQLEILTPDLVFLDIEMPQLNGFELLDRLSPIRFNVVFATAYNEFALKAFRVNALDYLVKPVSKEDLDDVIAKANKKQHLHDAQLLQVKEQLRQGHISKIAIPGLHQVTFIDIEDIVYAEASGNYTHIVLADKQKHLITRKLKELQDVLEEQHFLRIHRQYIINLNMVKTFNRNENLLTLSTGDIVPVSRSQRDRLIESYGWL
ncbi:MAG: LytTR family DNA-binding domain-containing protein [Niabella sp.]